MTDYIAETKNEFRSRDLYECSFLTANNCRLVRLDKGSGRQVWFVFEDLKKCQELSNLYWSGEATVMVTVFVDAIRKLKDRIFSQQDSFDAGAVNGTKGGGN